jgi:hypothetical protein
VHGAEPDDPGHTQPLDWALGLDADDLAELELLLAGRRLVDHDLVRRQPGASDSVSGLNRDSPFAMLKPRLGAPP